MVYCQRYILAADDCSYTGGERVVFASMDPSDGNLYWSKWINDPNIVRFLEDEDAHDFLKMYKDKLLNNLSIQNTRVLDIEPRVVSNIWCCR